MAINPETNEIVLMNNAWCFGTQTSIIPTNGSIPVNNNIGVVDKYQVTRVGIIKINIDGLANKYNKYIDTSKSAYRKFNNSSYILYTGNYNVGLSYFKSTVNSNVTEYTKLPNVKLIGMIPADLYSALAKTITNSLKTGVTADQLIAEYGPSAFLYDALKYLPNSTDGNVLTPLYTLPTTDNTVTYGTDHTETNLYVVKYNNHLYANVGNTGLDVDSDFNPVIPSDGEDKSYSDYNIVQDGNGFLLSRFIVSRVTLHLVQ